MSGVGKYRFAVLLAVVGLVSCGTEDNYAVEQGEAIVSYLNGKTYQVRGGTYVYLAGSTASTEDMAAQRGDSVSFYFAGYEFGSQPGTLFYTNKRYLMDEQPHLNAKYWSDEPVRIKIGDGTIIKGMENALVDCRQGDSLAVFMTSDAGYGSESMGIVPENTALMFVLNIVSVNK